MPNLNILHMSDLHFGSYELGLAPEEALRLTVEAIKSYVNDNPLLVAITGDITDRGSTAGFAAARNTLRSLAKHFPPDSIVLCPGNHDLVNQDVREFNKFSFEVTSDPHQRWTHEDPIATVNRHGFRIVLVNSYYRGDHKKGHIPLRDLRSVLSQSDNGSPTLVLVHDSPISSSYGAQGLIDGYDLLDTIAEFDVSALLHGHVHSNQALLIGRGQALVSGAGSLAFPPAPNMNNHFFLYTFTDGRYASGTEFRYFANIHAFKAHPLEVH